MKDSAVFCHYRHENDLTFIKIKLIGLRKMFLYTSSQSELFALFDVHFALTDRFGGVSTGAFDTLNLGFNVGDNLDDVAYNHSLVRAGFCNHFHIQQGQKCANMYYVSQIHSTRSIVLDECLEAKIPHNDASLCLGEADAIITNLPYRICTTMVADCNPILLYDKKQHAMAVIHAGRRGLFGDILSSVFLKMKSLYNTESKDCFVYVGASIRSCCYEVGEDVRKELFALGFSENTMSSNKLDMIACLQHQCEKLHIPSHQIEISPYCSCCESRLYSYRKQRLTGRFGLMAMLF